MATVLLTGGSGYIATHTAVALFEKGYDVVALDNLVNSSVDAIKNVEKLTGKDLPFYEGDCRDGELLDKIFSEHQIDIVIHFAGLKAVGESCQQPLRYYSNNLNATIVLLDRMIANGVNNLIFSSSATVYDPSNPPERKEGMLTGCTNPYGWTKYMSEQIIRDTAVVAADLSAVMLRYFNPVGAHPSGLIGENPSGIPNNLMPYIQQVATGKREYLHVYGDDYNTPDGTGVRDYIHVCDLADAHVAACDYAVQHKGTIEINVGNGHGTSVLELVHAFEKANGIEIPYQIEGRRAGDVDEMYADPTLAHELLGWYSTRTVEDMCKDAYRFQAGLKEENE